METETVHKRPNGVYKWEPLNLRKNEFRILQLHGVVQEEEGELLSISLQNVPMSGHPPYNALSYTWGDLSHQKKILLGGFPHWITRNLHEALCVLLNRGVHSLWVDALCIDQNDPDEKSAQVGRMATIFQEAETVDVWLGSATPESDNLLDFMRNVDHSMLEQQFWAQSFLAPGNGRPSSGKTTYIFDQVFTNILERPYWKRLWVAQEIAMASNIRVSCGPEYLDGSVFELLFSQNVWAKVEPTAFTEWRGYCYNLFEHMVNLWDIRAKRRSRQPIDLLSLMFQLRKSQTTELVDRVYAISGLAFDHRTFIAEPDYNLHPEKLCALMTQRFIRTTGSLDILLLNCVIGSKPWICRLLEFDRLWDNECDKLRFIFHYLNEKQHIPRCGILGSLWQTTKCVPTDGSTVILEEASIKVLGLRLGSCSSAASIADPDAEHGDDPPSDVSRDIELFDSLGRILLIHSSFYSNGDLLQQVTNALFKSMSIEANADRISFDVNVKVQENRTVRISKVPSVHTSLQQLLVRVIAVAESKAGGPLLDLPVATIHDAIESVRTVLADFNEAVAINSKHVGFKSRGWYYTLNSSDEAWLLSGLSWPVFLRRVEIGYKILGFGIVDSVQVGGKLCRVMDGEAWRTATQDDLEWVTFVET
ncbi:uncharacterized protein Z520_01915 [Fonsecaea multimorphosa CBS 102226]|uniref:Heterokaryon incompatibility domain-containing protein n=1 Tax=Fonsecaea multimorphosa CBS 102226 TaxID=1442371 RepID=A0A0D2IXK5_9EURO|nr:uncharacterized protein Z520_01915 [Fonsecaea multimorphosa CBS 102226]KIY01777.1 hypothetical protein Z520_01915 [Fonsecaea multimorphosa CBS 102226]OAL29970.1 hypothetical protein AYO22_01876 [Fonsecaea multimorphosa]